MPGFEPEFPAQISPPAPPPRSTGLLFAFRRLFARLPSRLLARSYDQLATMLGAGIPIREALHTLAGNHRGRARRIFTELADEVQGGGLLSLAMKRRPEVFGTFAPALIAVAEETGRLDESLGRLSRTLERLREIRNRIVSGLVYPCFLLHFAVLCLNAPLLVTAGTNAYFDRVLGILIPLWIAGFLLYLFWDAWKQSRIVGRIVLAIPFAGGLSRKAGLARFARSLASLYESGVDLPHAVDVASRMPANPVLKDSLAGAVPVLRSGRSLTAAVSTCRQITPMVRQMVETGEKSGSLGTSLAKVAEHYESETETAVRRMTKVVPMAIYLAIVLGIAIQIVSIYSKVLSM